MQKQPKPISQRRILVANRGEIAIRIFRAATELNMQTVAIYSYEDRFSVHRFKADEAYELGKRGEPLDAYLNWRNIIELAKEKQIDLIHPGYGFLSENPDFAQACENAGILFCGPSVKVLSGFGDKLAAKAIAMQASLPVIEGSHNALDTVEDALALAREISYPVTLKALSGGGGKGIRMVENETELKNAFERAQSEALSSFGKSEIYIEKHIKNPRHIEVQIAGDSSGNVIHLFERDCSVQRRHQKVVELAPALGISTKTRSKLFEYAVKIAKQVDYVGVGTVEFLVDENENIFFLEVNPRIQVEHTVTEMITGKDLVQMSIMLAAGRSLDHPAIGIKSQEDLKAKGVAIQCRITTENPQNNFAPDTGVILAYRPAQGFGIRLDEGFATSGGLVTPYYDSLLVKVTAHSNDLYGASSKMIRALKEFRIRGVKHNIPLLINIISHEKFRTAVINTRFLDESKELYNFPQPRDRATKLLKYIGEASVNNPHQLDKELRPKAQARYKLHTEPFTHELETQTAKKAFDSGGVDGLREFIKSSTQVLLTDTTMRDAHQSLFATRLRNHDIFEATSFYRNCLPEFFSLEVWGGATFDTCMRFLKEDPWERLAKIREQIPNIMLQMLLRGDNAVGYTNYPKWVIEEFIRLTVEHGLDIFRIFDCLNNPEQMQTAMETVKKHGAIVEACICYTGNIIDPKRHKYDLAYYLKLAKQLEKSGADILCIKDMAGLLRPFAANKLIGALKQEIDLPIHLHTHATAGNSEAMLLSAVEAGCDIIDGAVSSMSGLTSQPSINAVVAALENTPRSPNIRLEALDELSRYWADVRKLYKAFDPGLQATSTEVYEHEIPGGQYSNLYDQAKKVGLNSEDFFQLTLRYREVNELFGDLVKVTPSSKVVGDMALLLQKHKLTGSSYLEKKPTLDYPDSVISFFKGNMGVPYGGFPEEVRKLVLGELAPPPQKLEITDQDTLVSVKKELEQQYPNLYIEEKDVISYRLYPKVWKDFQNSRKLYGDTQGLPTEIFFYGAQVNQEFEVELEPGKTLILSLSGITDPDENATRRVFFQLNGFPRAIEIKDEKLSIGTKQNLKADITNPKHVAAPMPGKVLEVKAQVGQSIQKGDILLVTEAMKMEYAVTAKSDGKVSMIHVKKDDYIEEEDLLVELK